MPQHQNFALPPLGSPDRASFVAECIQALRGPNPQQTITALWNRWLHPPTYSLLQPSSDTCPSWFFIKDDNQSLVVVDGTDSLAQVTGQVNAYLANRFSNRNAVHNVWYENAADGIVNALGSRGVTLPAHNALGGWSAGGAIVANLPARPATKANYGNEWLIDTFGAPRPYGKDLAGTNEATSRMLRWMNHNDPVPIVPPHSNEYLAQPLLFGIDGSQVANSFVHGGAGYDVASNGVLTPALLPIAASGNFGASLINWLNGLRGQDDIEHSISVYKSRLDTATSLLGTRVVRFHQQIEIPERVQNHTQNMRAQAINTAIVNLEGRQNAAPLIVPPAMRYRAVRLTRLWYVYFGDTQVAMPGTRRAARALAREFNAALDRLQRTAVVDIKGVQDAFTAYLAAATNPAGGFSPIMNTEIPEIT